MVTIFGYKGSDQATKKIIEGLENIEYRGYDSAGIAVASDSSIELEKGAGEINALNPSFNGGAGIGHTRWRTHGAVTDDNAHPHTSENGKVAVVHNGIIENYRELREQLGEERFESETDSEVIPHLLEQELEEHCNVKTAVEETVDQLEGSYGVTALLETGELAAFKNRSPLLLGINGDETYISSEVNGFLEHTDKAVYLNNGDYAIIDEGLEIFNSGQKVEREIDKIERLPQPQGTPDWFEPEDIERFFGSRELVGRQDVYEGDSGVLKIEDLGNKTRVVYTQGDEDLIDEVGSTGQEILTYISQAVQEEHGI